MEGLFMTSPQPATSCSWPQKLISRATVVSVIPRALASFGGAQEPDPAPRNLIHQARSAPSWLACPPPRLAAILGAQAAAGLCSPGTMRPHAAQYGGSPPPHSTGSHPTGAPEALEVCRFWLRQRAWRKTAIHKHDEHSPRRTRRGPRAALPPQKKGRGTLQADKPFRWKKYQRGFIPLPAEQKGPFWIPCWAPRRGQQPWQGLRIICCAFVHKPQSCCLFQEEARSRTAANFYVQLNLQPLQF